MTLVCTTIAKVHFPIPASPRSTHTCSHYRITCKAFWAKCLRASFEWSTCCICCHPWHRAKLLIWFLMSGHSFFSPLTCELPMNMIIVVFYVANEVHTPTWLSPIIFVTWSRGMSRMSGMLLLSYWQKQCSNSFVLCCF